MVLIPARTEDLPIKQSSILDRTPGKSCCAFSLKVQHFSLLIRDPSSARNLVGLIETLLLLNRVRINLKALAKDGLADVSDMHFSENSGTLRRAWRIEFA